MVNFHVSLQSKSFSRHVEDLCHLLLKRSSVFSPDDSQDVVFSLIQTLLFVENHLMTLQEADLQVQMFVLFNFVVSSVNQIDRLLNR